MNTEIRDLADDEWITEPGFYRITLDRHHNQPCLSPDARAAFEADGTLPPITEVSVTSGVLRTIELQTPADAWCFHVLNANRFTKPETKALRLGRAMAAFIEGGEAGLNEVFRTLPEDAPRRPTPQQIKAYEEDRSTEAGKASVEFWAKIEADPREIVTHDEWILMRDMGAALIRDPAAQIALSGEPEITMAWQDEATGLWFLSRPDTVSFDGTSADYKKMSAQGRPFNYRLVDQRITDHGYDCQMGFAAEVLQNLTGIWPECSIIAQSDKPPYHVIPRVIDERDLRMGMFRNRRAARTFAHCYETGDWPGPAADIGAYQRPQWQEDMLLEQMEVEGFAP